jgi:hypothetical protein
MLKVLFGSWVGIASLSALIFTVVAVSAVLGYCLWNEEKTREKILMLLTTMLVAFSGLSYSNAYCATLPLSEEEKADLTFMREEEKLARDTYLKLYEIWKLSVFSNIASSEQMHMDALLKLLKKYALPDPAAGNEIGEFTNDDLQALYEQLIDRGNDSNINALKVGGLIEEKDMLDINAAIERSQQKDIDKVYESLLCGSRNHLRSFAQNIEALSGQPYDAQLLTQNEVDVILDSPMEKCSKQ